MLVRLIVDVEIPKTYQGQRLWPGWVALIPRTHKEGGIGITLSPSSEPHVFGR